MHLRTQSILAPRPPAWWVEAFSVIETFSAIALAGWAAVNMTSPDHLSLKNFWPLLSLAPDLVWEYVSLAIGVAQMAAVLSGNRWLRGGMAILAMAMFGDLALTLIVAAQRANIWPPGCVMLYASFWFGNAVAICKNTFSLADGKRV